MYRLAFDGTVVRNADNACIPDDPRNVDRRDYLQWLADGNTPTAYQPAGVDQAAAVKRAKDARKLVLDALSVIAGRLQRAGDLSTALVCDQLAEQLLAVDLKGIAALAADDAHFDAAVMLAYRTLAAGAPAVVAAAFKELS